MRLAPSPAPAETQPKAETTAITAEELRLENLKKEQELRAQLAVAEALEDKVKSQNQASREQHVAEAEGLLRQLAAKERNAEIKRQMDEDIATIEGAASPVSAIERQMNEDIATIEETTPPAAAAPEQETITLTLTRPEAEKMLKLLQEGAQKMRASVEYKAATRGERVLNTVRNAGAWYNKRPLWQKVLFGGALLALGVPGASGVQKVLSGAGMFVTIEALTRDRIKNQFVRGAVAGGGAVAYALIASELFKSLGITQGITDFMHNWLNPAEATAPAAEVAPDVTVTLEKISPAPEPASEPPPPEAPAGTPSEVPPEAPPAAPTVPMVEALTTAATIGRGDTVWGLIESKLGGSTEFAALDRAQKDFVLDSYLKHLRELGPSGVREFGVQSGDVNVIRIGETLNMEKIADRSLLDQYVQDARGLSAAQKENILRARR